MSPMPKGVEDDKFDLDDAEVIFRIIVVISIIVLLLKVLL